MDQILKGIINSNHPKALKQQLIDRCLISLPSQSVSPSDYLSVLRISWEYAVNGDNDFVQDVGVKVYTTWMSYDQTLLEEFFNAATLNNFLSDESIKNKDILLKLIGCTLKQLQESSNFPSLCRIIQCRCTSYLHNNGTLPVLKQLIELLHLLPLCIPCGESAGTLAVIVIQFIADTEIPKSMNNFTDFMADINAVSSFIAVLWSTNESIIEKVFNAIFLRLSSEESTCSPAISSTIDVLPLQLIDNIHSSVKRTSPRKLAITVIKMLDCLSWPGVLNLHKWIITVFHALAEAAMYTFLARLFEATIEQVYNKLYIAVTRRPAVAVLTYMLLSYQHSPILFHKIAGDIPKLLEQLKEQEKNHRTDLEEIARLFFTAMHLHAGFPDQYDPILKELESCQAPSMAMMQEELAKYQWGSVSKYRVSSFSAETGRLKITRSQTGLTGLENIGNTCYINSILQALYMTHSMQKAVLEAKPNLEEKLLPKLQEVFAYLALTKRPAYSPKKFVESSLPPWFERGEQQDCAEFLRFILNTLMEEWKAFNEKEEKKPNCSEGDTTLKNESDNQRSFIEDIFGGILETTHKCLNCNNISSHSERFTDFHIPFPDYQVVRNVGNGSSAQPLHLKDLFDNCFEPERLEGENMYHCEKCNAHCIAERSAKITHLPSHLILALLRFSYDSKSGRRTKILTEVDCPQLLRISFHEKDVDYYLHAVIVHAGTSAEQGHYYTFARHFQEHYNFDSSSERENLCASGDNGHWYLLNDSNISHSSFSALRNLTRRYSKDTAYVLFYQKIPDEGRSEAFSQIPFICNELRNVIAEDNMKYLMEQENEVQENSGKSNLLDFKCNFYKDFDDPPSGGCGSSSGGSDMSFPRFVC